MPKKVDHEARREEIARAAFRVIGRNGVARATIRDIARESGYSVGAVVHYVPTRHHILLQAADYSTRSAIERIDRIEHANTGLEALRQVVYSNLPGSDDMIGHWRIWFGFWQMSDESEPIKVALRGRYDASFKLYARLIRNAQRLGDVPPGIAVAPLAIDLTCQIDGIGVHVLISGRDMPFSRQRQRIDRWIDGMLLGKGVPAPGPEPRLTTLVDD